MCRSVPLLFGSTGMEEIQEIVGNLAYDLEPCAICGVEISILRAGYCPLCSERLDSKELIFD
jgi:hypothetical protein